MDVAPSVSRSRPGCSLRGGPTRISLAPVLASRPGGCRRSHAGPPGTSERGGQPPAGGSTGSLTAHIPNWLPRAWCTNERHRRGARSQPVRLRLRADPDDLRHHLPADHPVPAARPTAAGGADALAAHRSGPGASAAGCPPRGWMLRFVALSVLYCSAFFPLLFIAAYRLPGGVAVGDQLADPDHRGRAVRAAARHRRSGRSRSSPGCSASSGSPCWCCAPTPGWTPSASWPWWAR